MAKINLLKTAETVKYLTVDSVQYSHFLSLWKMLPDKNGYVTTEKFWDVFNIIYRVGYVMGHRATVRGKYKERPYGKKAEIREGGVIV